MQKFPLANCEECPLCTAPQTVGRFAQGVVYKTADTVIVGEGPGAQEARKGEAFVGPSGELLYTFLDATDLGTVYLTNSELCWVSNGDEKIKLAASKCCRERLVKEVMDLKPRLIITLGGIATNVLLGQGPGITKRRGIVDKFQDTMVLPMIHPSAVLHNPNMMRDVQTDFAKAKQLLKQVTVVEENRDPKSYTFTSDWREVLRAAERSKFAVLDLETSGLRVGVDKPFLMVVATGSQTFLMGVPTLLDAEFLATLPKARVAWVGHNAKFDLDMLQTIGTRVTFKFDTMLAGYLFDERSGTHGLKETCARLYNVPPWDATLKQQLRDFRGVRIDPTPKKVPEDYSKMPWEILYPYAAQDGYWNYKLTEYEARRLAGATRFRWIFDNLLMPGLHALSDAEVRGIHVDTAALERKTIEYRAECDLLERQIQEAAGEKLNPRSFPQVAHHLFDVLKMPQINGRCTDVNVLERLPQVPFVVLLREYRKVQKLLSTYLEGMVKHLTPGNVIHTTYNLSGTTTGRLSSNTPNMQNIPARGKRAKDIKNLFVPGEGNVFVDSDLSQAELRMVAWLSEDPFLMEVYRNNEDLHAKMAAEIYGAHYTKDERSFAKRLNFGLMYFRSVQAIANDAMYSISTQEAKRIHALFFDRIPGVVKLQEDTRKFVLANGYVDSPVGRRRRFPQVFNDSLSRNEREEIVREGFNHRPQSGASDVTLLAYINLWKAGYRPTLTTHDSIVTEVERRMAQETLEYQNATMVAAWEELYGAKVPMVADGEIAIRWGERLDE